MICAQAKTVNVPVIRPPADIPSSFEVSLNAVTGIRTSGCAGGRALGAGRTVWRWLAYMFLVLYMPVCSYAAEPAYTIQTGSFLAIEPAVKHFYEIKQRVHEDRLSNLRIEKIGRYYSVRIGDFKDYPSAGLFLEEAASGLGEAMILRAFIRDERIILLYHGPSLPDEPARREEPLLNDSDRKGTAYAEAEYALGMIYGNSGRDKDAVQALQRALQADPFYGDAYFALGVISSRLKRYQEAIEAYRAALRIAPDEHRVYVNLGVIYDELGMYAEAIEAGKAAIRINPDDAKAYYNLGLTYSHLGRYPEAIDAARRAIELRPDNADAYQVLGWAYLGNNNREMAVEQYQTLTTLDPEKAAALYDLMYPLRD